MKSISFFFSKFSRALWARIWKQNWFLWLTIRMCIKFYLSCIMSSKCSENAPSFVFGSGSSQYVRRMKENTVSNSIRAFTCFYAVSPPTIAYVIRCDEQWFDAYIMEFNRKTKKFYMPQLWTPCRLLNRFLIVGFVF